MSEKLFENKNINERDKELLIRAKRVLTENILEGNEYPWSPLRGIVPSLSTYKGVWNWDAAFHALATARWDKELAFDQCKIIWNTQKENGMFCDVWYAEGRADYGACKPPVFPWAFMRAYNLNPDEEVLKTAYDKYVKNESFWVNERFSDGLFHYYSIDGGIYAKYESGWDTSVRWDEFGAQNLFEIDLNCYAVMMYKALASMAEILKNGEEKKWLEKAEKLSERINEFFWSEEKGAYTDIKISDKKSTGVLSPASFMPLYIGIADKARAEKLAALAADKNAFYPLMPTVSYDNPSYSSGDYWRGPTWLNTAYFAVKGLKDYGFKELAEDLREHILNAVYNEKRGIYEYYDSKSGEGLGAFNFGWSAAFIIEFILDF